MLRLRRVLGWILVFLGSTPLASAAVLGVPNPFQGIQSALDATVSGDTVLVERGTYAEHLLGPGHGFTLMSHWPMTRDSADWEETIVDGTFSGTCLRLQSTELEWVTLKGLVIANGQGEGLPGGIFCRDSVNVDLDHIILRDHIAIGNIQDNAIATCMRLRVPMEHLRISNLLVSNTMGDERANVAADILSTITLDSIEFNGFGNVGHPGKFVSNDSLWAHDLLFRDFSVPGFYTGIGGHGYTYMDGVEIRNMRGDNGTVINLAGGTIILRNIHLHDNLQTGTGQGVDPELLTVTGGYVDIDSMIVENNVMVESDMIYIDNFETVDPAQRNGNINHLIVRNNYAGTTTPFPEGYNGRIALIRRCNLRNSIFTGNTSELPIPINLEHGFSHRWGSVLHLHHESLDTLFIENVEFSHNELIDHDDHWALFGSLGREFVLGSLGHALFLGQSTSNVTIIRDCIFHDIRIANTVPETDWYWSLGSTFHILDGNTLWPSYTFIDNCSFTDNDEGGLMTEFGVDAVIRNCVFKNNGRYGMYLTGLQFDIQNVLIEGTVSSGYALQSLPSRQSALKVAQNGPEPGIFRNITVRNCNVRNLFTGNLASLVTESEFTNFLVADNTYDNLEAFWNNPEHDQPIQWINCLLPEVPDAGEENLIQVDPLFDTELGAPWLSALSPCIDAGIDDAATDDIEDPDNLGYALWPSQGTLRNDIGYTGGPYAGTLDHLVAVRKPAAEPIVQPASFTLHPAYPNPFNPTTTLSYTLASPMQIELSVFNLLGQQVRTLAFGMQEAGENSVPFVAGELASGVYVVELTAGGHNQTQKVLLLK